MQASGGGDGSVRLWHVRSAVTSVESVHTSWVNTAPPGSQVVTHRTTVNITSSCYMNFISKRYF